VRAFIRESAGSARIGVGELGVRWSRRRHWSSPGYALRRIGGAMDRPGYAQNLTALIGEVRHGDGDEHSVINPFRTGPRAVDFPARDPQRLTELNVKRLVGKCEERDLAPDCGKPLRRGGNETRLPCLSTGSGATPSMARPARVGRRCTTSSLA